jgi:hypothetical protein
MLERTSDEERRYINRIPKNVAEFFGINEGEIVPENIAERLRELISTSPSSPEFKLGLNLLSFLRSLVEPSIRSEILKRALKRDFVARLKELLKPETIVKSYREDYSIGMGLLTLLEVLMPYLTRDEAVKLLTGLSKAAVQGLEGEALREFSRALIYGPLTNLKSEVLESFLMFMEHLNGHPNIALLKAELLVAILRMYPPKVFIERPGIVGEIGKVLKDVSSTALRAFTEDTLIAERIYWEVNNILSAMSSLCGEIKDWSPCQKILNIAGNELNKMYDVVGRELAKGDVNVS